MPTGILQKKNEEIERICNQINGSGRLIEELTTFKAILDTQIIGIVNGKKRRIQSIRVHHKNPFSETIYPYKGGMRYHKAATVELFCVLAQDMTLKNSLALLPFGGAKGGLIFDPTECTVHELQWVTEQMTENMLKFNMIGSKRDVWGPDVGTNSTIMSWIVNKIDNGESFPLATVTGKPVDVATGGIPGREDATSHGLLLQLNEFLRLTHQTLPDVPRMNIQGFGNVGYNLARLVQEKRFNFCVRTVSDEHGGIFNPRGLDVTKVKDWYDAHKTLEGYKDADSITNKELLEMETDILIPAAIENQITEKNAPRIKAKIVYEGGNEAVTPEAHKILYDRGIPTVPGIAANAGGVVVSFLEWQKNLEGPVHSVDFPEEKKRVTKELSKIMKRIIKDVLEKASELSCSFYDAAYIVAIERLRDNLHRKHGDIK
ncbi:MAG: Glu/Leu/Phe/Val dehydrogenase [Parcubacteria group bacterium]|nr:Glu/Leu/Phe/Val dehydrogenase [Parcubacteria group bacterium]